MLSTSPGGLATESDFGIMLSRTIWQLSSLCFHQHSVLHCDSQNPAYFNSYLVLSPFVFSYWTTLNSRSPPWTFSASQCIQLSLLHSLYSPRSQLLLLHALYQISFKKCFLDPLFRERFFFFLPYKLILERKRSYLIYLFSWNVSASLWSCK